MRAPTLNALALAVGLVATAVTILADNTILAALAGACLGVNVACIGIIRRLQASVDALDTLCQQITDQHQRGNPWPTP